MTILYPEVFWFFIPLALLLVPAALHYQWGKDVLIALGGVWRKSVLYQTFLTKTFLYWITIFLAFSFLTIAVAEISWGRKAVIDNSEGLDIIFAMDISRSMLARDVVPDRLARGIELITTLAASLQGRMGIVIFKGDGRVFIPLTKDRIALEQAVRSLSPSLYTQGGSNLEKGLQKAIDSFPPGGVAKKNIILITDGESLEGNPYEAVQRAHSLDINLFVVGVGTEEGSLLYDAQGALILQPSGEPVVSKQDRKLLEGLARRGGGQYYSLGDIQSPRTLIQSVEELGSSSMVAGVRFQKKNAYRLFLLLGIGFLALNILLMQIRWSQWY